MARPQAVSCLSIFLPIAVPSQYALAVEVWRRMHGELCKAPQILCDGRERELEFACLAGDALL